MEFLVGDTLPAAKLEQYIRKSRSNLLNTELFNFVKINKQLHDKKARIVVEVTEQWYSWIFPIFELADRNLNTWWETKDFSRADYGLLFIQENFRGRREYITLKAITGYNEYLNFQYSIPYIDREKRFGIDFIAESARRHETSVITQRDELSFFKAENGYPFRHTSASVNLRYRPAINNKHNFTIIFDDYAFKDTLLSMNPDFISAAKPETRFLTLKYMLESDYRDYMSYPLHGHYLELALSKNGLGLFGNGVNFWQLRGEYAKYWQLKNRLYFASSLKAMISEEKNHPYFLNKGLGYKDDFVRAYEYNVINGNAFGLLRTNLKYTLVPTQTFTLDFIPLEQFRKVFFAVYLNIFTDVGYVDGFDNWTTNGNSLPDTMMLGKGVGIDLVTYYEKVLRIEYSWNKQNEGGVFVHFRAPI